MRLWGRRETPPPRPNSLSIPQSGRNNTGVLRSYSPGKHSRHAAPFVCRVVELLVVIHAVMAEPPLPIIKPRVRIVDLNLGDSLEVELADGKRVMVKVLQLKETRDLLRDAVRMGQVQVDVDGKTAWLTSAHYELPQTVGSVQIDCAIMKGDLANSSNQAWALDKDVRLWFWPAGSPWSAVAMVCPAASSGLGGRFGPTRSLALVERLRSERPL